MKSLYPLLRTIEILIRAARKTSEIPDLLAPSSPGPRDPWKSWKKPHNLRTIPGTLEILEKTSQSADHPRDPENPGKNLTILRICLVVVVVVGFADKLCRDPLRGQTTSFCELTAAPIFHRTHHRVASSTKIVGPRQSLRIF